VGADLCYGSGSSYSNYEYFLNFYNSGTSTVADPDAFHYGSGTCIFKYDIFLKL
jgi:hypothetical protein